MAVVKKGPMKGFSGKLGDLVFYQNKGKTIVRPLGVYTKAPTNGQKTVRAKCKLLADFLRPLKNVVKLGYGIVETGLKDNAYNQAVSYHYTNAITGVYPDFEIDYSKVLLCSGQMPVEPEIKVTLTDLGLKFEWPTENSLPGTHWTDQAILIACAPASSKAMYFLGAARRNQGTDHLPLRSIPRGQLLETYLAFVSDDRSSISDSIPTGRFFW